MLRKNLLVVAHLAARLGPWGSRHCPLPVPLRLPPQLPSCDNSPRPLLRGTRCRGLERWEG
eukprot:scaffold142082_cov32-Tisochrysis_lutea.AAC.1